MLVENRLPVPVVEVEVEVYIKYTFFRQITTFFSNSARAPEVEVFRHQIFCEMTVGEDGTLIKVVLDRSGVYLGKFDFFFVKTQWGHKFFENA